MNAIEQHPDYERYRELADNPTPDARKRKVKYERFLHTADNVALAENLRRLNYRGRLAEYKAIVAAESSALTKQGLESTTSHSWVE